MTETPEQWRARIRSVGTIRRIPKVAEGRDDSGRWKATTDDQGNTVTERAGDRQDVTINAPRVVAATRVTEER